ncbi:MAG: rhomboid family intramembrane serine protease [Candidatus Pacearchaeota archaeon]|jgi:membrane associated rhomboid family serine protease
MKGVYQIYPKRKGNFFSGFSVTINLILINIACFVLFTILLFIDVNYLDFIALKPSNILGGKYLWTFLTSMFMHGGFFHIFANMFSLFFIGSLIEKILGRKRYLWFYIFSGLFAGIFFVLSSLIFQNDFNTFAVGASGALFGVAGLMVMLTPNLPLYVMFIPIPIKAKYAIPGLLFILWLISVTANVGIGNTAHLGGLVAGLVYGIYLQGKFPNKVKMISKRFS